MNADTETVTDKKIGDSREWLNLFKLAPKVDVANASILPCSVARFREQEAHKAQMRELRKAVEARYAEQLTKAGWWRRMELRRLINAEYRREAERIGPSPRAL